MKRSRAFTLLELLVVVGIVVVLIAVLIPVLGKTRETTRRAICASQLRAQGSMASIYAARFNDRLPTFNGNPMQPANAGQPPGPPLRPGPTAPLWWWDESCDFADALTDNLSLNSSATKIGTTPAKQRQLFFCPSNTDWAAAGLKDWQATQFPVTSVERSLGYGWLNNRGNGPDGKPGTSDDQAGPLATVFTDFKAAFAPAVLRSPPLKLVANVTGVRQASISELAFDAIISQNDPPMATDFGQVKGSAAGLRTNHMEGTKVAGGNILLCDGHVEWRKMPWTALRPNGIGIPTSPATAALLAPFFWIPNP